LKEEHLVLIVISYSKSPMLAPQSKRGLTDSPLDQQCKSIYHWKKKLYSWK